MIIAIARRLFYNTLPESIKTRLQVEVCMFIKFKQSPSISPCSNGDNLLYCICLRTQHLNITIPTLSVSRAFPELACWVPSSGTIDVEKPRVQSGQSTRRRMRREHSQYVCLLSQSWIGKWCHTALVSSIRLVTLSVATCKVPNCCRQFGTLTCCDRW